MKKYIIIFILVLAGFCYGAFLKYTGSRGFVQKNIDALNLSYRYSNAEFKTVCDKMSPFSYVSGLSDGAFLVIGGKTYYYKSRCYQELARRTQDEDLCAKVIERKVLFGDGSGVSPKECRRGIAAAKHHHVPAGSSNLP